MKFIRNNSLKPNMVLARDLHLFDTETNKLLLLRKGVQLTNVHIDRLKEIGISGAFIRDGVGDDFELKTLMQDEEKVKAILEIKNVFDHSMSEKSKVTEEDIDNVQKVADNLVETIASNENIRISIGDLKSYDDYTYFHSLSVAVLSIAIGTKLNLPPMKLKKLGLCALLHDIGKMSISKDIINKPGKLTDEEFEIIKTHPKCGSDYLRSNYLVDEETAMGVESHHEHFDGTGYPHGLKGKEIPLFGRIIAVADVYDSVTSNRSYRDPSQPNDAFELIMGSSYTHFDAEIVTAFLHKIEPYPIGSVVRLSNNEVGIIVHTDDELPLRPTVKILKTGVIYELKEVSLYRNLTILGFYAECEVEVVEK